MRAPGRGVKSDKKERNREGLVASEERTLTGKEGGGV